MNNKQIELLENIERYEKEYIEDRNYDCRYRRILHDFTSEYFLKFMKPFLVNANPVEYAEFLKGWLSKGNSISHQFDFDMPNDYYVAIADFKAIPLYGASAITVIVPEDVNIDRSLGDGHSKYLFMDGFRSTGNLDSYRNVYVKQKINPSEVRITIEVECKKHSDSKKRILSPLDSQIIIEVL